MLIDLLRHGEPQGGRRYRGHSDDPLSELGWQQMWQAVGETLPWQHIITSPLQRCRAFAEQLSSRHAISLSVDPRFMEVGFGEWEGHTVDELRRRDAAQVQRFFDDPVVHRPPGAEPLVDFAARVAAAWHDAQQSWPERHLLIICHAGVIRAVLAQVLGAPLRAMYRIQVETGGLTRIRCTADAAPSLVFHSRTRV